jgi:hypothetical protein
VFYATTKIPHDGLCNSFFYPHRRDRHARLVAACSAWEIRLQRGEQRHQIREQLVPDPLMRLRSQMRRRHGKHSRIAPKLLLAGRRILLLHFKRLATGGKRGVRQRNGRTGIRREAGG